MDFAAFAAKEKPSSRTAYFTTRENKRLLGHVVKQFDVLQPVVFEKRLVYFHKLHNVIQEGRQGNLWT